MVVSAAEIPYRVLRLERRRGFFAVGLHGASGVVARVCKEILHWTDTYVLDVADPADALRVLMFTLAVDAEKCSKN